MAMGMLYKQTSVNSQSNEDMLHACILYGSWMVLPCVYCVQSCRQCDNHMEMFYLLPQTVADWFKNDQLEKPTKKIGL